MGFEICAIQNNIVTLRTGLCTLYRFQSPYTVKDCRCSNSFILGHVYLYAGAGVDSPYLCVARWIGGQRHSRKKKLSMHDCTLFLPSLKL